MSLIVIATLGWQLSPFEISASLNFLERALETAHLAKYFWCHPYLIIEEFEEASRTQTYLVGNVADARDLRSANEITEGIPDCRMS